MADSSLAAIQDKVRRITRSPSEAYLTDAQLNQYINTFVLYDFPSEIRLFNLRQVFTFYTDPYVDTYSTNTVDTLSPLYNFKNKYISVHPPLFMAGVQCFYTQWRDIFYGYYPQTNTIGSTNLVGDGTSGPFTGTVTAVPALQNNVIFSCLDTSGESMVLIDYPVSNSTAALGLPNQPQTLPSPYGQFNYITGAFSGLTFPNATQISAPINATTIAYQPGKPLAMLYYNDTFTIRPVPDKAYAIQIEVDVRPTELLASNQSPDLEQWWQYIALGTSLRIFEDKVDLASISEITPLFKQQESKVLRTTLTQMANERTVTIYTQGKQYGFGWFAFGAGGWPY